MLIQLGNITRKLPFLLVSSTDHIAGLTGKAGTVTVSLSKNGAGGGVPAGAIAEVDATNQPGWYTVAANATDANAAGSLLLHAAVIGSDPCDVQFEVVAFNPDDAVRMGQTALPAVAAGGKGGLPITDASTGLKLTGYGGGEMATLISVGTSAGQINASSGVVPASGNWNTAAPLTAQQTRDAMRLATAATAAKGGIGRLP